MVCHCDFAFPWWLMMLGVFSYAYKLFVYLPRRNVYLDPLPVLNLSLLWSCKGSLFWILNPYQMWFGNIFSYSVVVILLLYIPEKKKMSFYSKVKINYQKAWTATAVNCYMLWNEPVAARHRDSPSASVSLLSFSSFIFLRVSFDAPTRLIWMKSREFTP